MAYDASTGTELWVTRYNGPGNGDDYAAYALGMSPDGSAVFVTGYSVGSGYGGASDYATVAYEPGTGRRLWVARYDGAGRDDHGPHGAAYRRRTLVRRALRTVFLVRSRWRC